MLRQVWDPCAYQPTASRLPGLTRKAHPPGGLGGCLEEEAKKGGSWGAAHGISHLPSQWTLPS